LVINVRNLLYLITVGYKISRRLALLAPAPLPVRLSGAALTLLGMFLGLWQSTFYTAVDAAFEMLLGKAIVLGLSQCSLAAVVAWQLWAVFGLQLRTGCKAWQLAKMTFREARLVVLAPQALLVNNQALVSAGVLSRGAQQVVHYCCVAGLHVASCGQQQLVGFTRGGAAAQARIRCKGCPRNEGSPQAC
jgi:hypothetical protein